MNESPSDAKPGWWTRAQQVMAALVVFSGEAAKVASDVRRIFGKFS